MGSLVPLRPSGARRYDQFTAIAERLATQFEGGADVSPSRLLSRFKRAAPYMGVPRSVVALLDELFAHTRPQDWKIGRVPTVWPRNETLALRLRVSVRQLQNILREAIERGFIVPRDSANGHRGGSRNAEGEIIFAYGFDLRPIGTRQDEFQEIAAAGADADRRIDVLRRRLTAARRKIRMLCEAVELAGAGQIDGEAERELVRMALALVRGSRDEALLKSCVDQVEMRLVTLQAQVNALFEPSEASETHAEDANFSSKTSPSGETDFIHSTTTTQLKTSHEVTRRGFPGKSSEGLDVGRLAPISNVEADLERHGVGPEFIAKSCPYVVAELDLGPRGWGRLISIAEQASGRHGIPIGAFREASRVMGQHGAAAAVLATIQKRLTGEVRSTGAYLRGMTVKASAGELNLGRTFHGLKETAEEMFC